MPSRNENPNRNETFGRLLSGAINSIATYEGRTTPVVEEELGQLLNLSGKTIQRYKAGHLPPEHETVKVLAEAAVRRGFLDREWLQRFLHAARYPFADKLLDQLKPIGPARPRPPRVYENLPAPTYSQFVMREQAFAEVADGLQQRSAVVLIVGLGGNGKTSLAREVAARCLQVDGYAPRFDAAVWVSDKDRPSTTNLSIVLNEIARTLNCSGFVQLDQEEKRRGVEQLLKHQRVLIVVDNFETITDDAMLTWLLRLPEPSKAIVTSCEYGRAFRNSTIVTELRGMSEVEALEFIEQRLLWLRITPQVSNQTQLEPLLIATGGNPKAIEIALGLVKHGGRPLQQVVDDFYAARGELFDDLFTRAWTLLDEAARQVLMVMTFFPTSASSEALSTTADVQGYTFDRAIERLIDLSLVDVQQANLHSAPRYTLHPLVRSFAHNKFCGAIEFEQQARLRWCEYFIALLKRDIVRDAPRDRYWNTLINAGMTKIDIEQINLLMVLDWTDETHQYRYLVELMILLAHYMDRRASLHPYRRYYARGAAEAAHKLDLFIDEAILRIDTLGWFLIEEGQLNEAEKEIMVGLNQIRVLQENSTDTNNLVALAQAFLARINLYRNNTMEALMLINSALTIECCMPVRCRVLWIAGETHIELANYEQALEFYQESEQVSLEYGGEWTSLNPDIGFIYFAQGDLERAAVSFQDALSLPPHEALVQPAIALYGLARIAYANKAIDDARKLAQEGLNTLSRIRIKHHLATKIKDLLKKIEIETIQHIENSNPTRAED
jgi:tetratricopeptide (TPR) repeat protein